MSDRGKAGGPVWDGLATVVQDHSLLGGFILVNAFDGGSAFSQSGCQASDPGSRQLIQRSLDATKAWLKVDPSIDWMTSRSYPYAARLAHLFFLRQVLKKDAWMVDLVFFSGDSASRASSIHHDLGLDSIDVPGRVQVEVDVPFSPAVEKCRLCNTFYICHHAGPISRDDLTQSPPDWLRGSREVARHRFQVNGTALDVTCNVYHLPIHQLHEAWVAVKLATIGIEGLREQMNLAIGALEDCCDGLGDSRCEGCEYPLEELRRIRHHINEESVAGDVELLQRWDRIMEDLKGRSEGACPILQFLRGGFFLPQEVKHGERVYPIGCYVGCSDKEPYGSEQTILHELLMRPWPSSETKGPWWVAVGWRKPSQST